MRSIVAGVVAALLGCGAAHADTSVSGWDVSSKPDGGVCTAARAYKDSGDGDKENAVVLGLQRVDDGLRVYINLSYIDWTFSDDEDIKADLLIDDEPVFKDAKWKGNKHGLTAAFQGGDILEKFGNGKKVVLHFDEGPHFNAGDAVFLMPNAGMAMGAVQQCLDAK